MSAYSIIFPEFVDTGSLTFDFILIPRVFFSWFTFFRNHDLPRRASLLRKVPGFVVQSLRAIIDF